eukprot:1004638-Pyramimonas_sp.AAC.1
MSVTRALQTRRQFSVPYRPAQSTAWPRPRGPWSAAPVRCCCSSWRCRGAPGPARSPESAVKVRVRVRVRVSVRVRAHVRVVVEDPVRGVVGECLGECLGGCLGEWL